MKLFIRLLLQIIQHKSCVYTKIHLGVELLFSTKDNLFVTHNLQKLENQLQMQNCKTMT